MADPTSTFSIREYALNKRSTDLTTISWPFSEKVKKEVAESLLPPMDVKKFRWWSSLWLSSQEEEGEKEVITERIKMQKICPVCGVFVAATVAAVNAHIDTCLAQTTSKEIRRKNYLKAKSRTPKKRSIAEIFAVAPPVKTMIVVNDCREEEEKKAVGKQIIHPNKNLKTTSLATSLVSAIKTIKNKIATTTEQPTILAKKKKKKRKKKNKIKEFGHGKLCKKGDIRNHKDVSTFCKRRPCFKRLSKQKKKKLAKKSTVVAKQQRPMPPLRSILKRSVKAISETNSSFINLKGSNQAFNNGGQKSDRRVSFLDKDDVLGPSTRAISDTFEQNVGNPFQASEVGINSGESNKVPSMEANLNDDVDCFNTRHKVDSQHVKGKIQLPNFHNQVNAERWENAKHSTEKLILESRDIPHDRNDLHSFAHVYVDAHQKLPLKHSAIPALLAEQEERPYGHVRTQCGLNNVVPQAHSLYGKSVDNLINNNNHFNGVAALGSVTSRVPSSSLTENPVSRLFNLAESSARDSNRFQFPNGEQSVVTYKEKGVNDGFFCLPLNSRGELIQLNSGLTDRFDQMNEASNTMAGSSRIPVCNLVVPRSRDYFVDNEKLFVDTKLTGNQLTLFPLHSHMQENQNRYLPAGFDVPEPGTSETADIRLMSSERGTETGRFFHPKLMDSPFNRCRYYEKFQNQNVSTQFYPENSSSMCVNPGRQTMRLMGKDVAVGGNGKDAQEPEVINFLKNSHLVGNCLTNPIQETHMRKRNFLQDRELHYPSRGETLFYHPAGFHGNQVAQGNLLANAPQAVRYPHPCTNRKSSILYPRPESVINLNERFSSIHSFPPSSTDTLNMARNFQAPFVSGLETQRFCSQPSAFSTSHHMCPNRYENSFELGFNQSLHPAKLGTFNFPFLQQDDGNHVQLPWSHTSKSLSPWILHDHQRELPPTANSKLADINGYYCPCTPSGTDVLISPSSIHHRLETAYPCSTMAYSHLQTKNHISGSTSFFQPIPIAPRVLQSPIANAGHEIRMRSEDRLKFNSLSVKDSDFSSKKQLAEEFVDSRKRQKTLSLETNNSGIVPEWTRGKYSDDHLKSNPGMKKIHANRDKAVNSVGNIPNMTQTTDGIVISANNNEAHKVECTARSGPIKLTAGAKHILKPSQSMDVDNTKPTYSTIPSAGLVHSDSLAGSQKKSTKVYSF
uniref:UBZ4-type domain-containing protein n=2 Tax=Cucumis melo TaxID=3656 RepID=A0A9I9D852_CUCME